LFGETAKQLIRASQVSFHPFDETQKEKSEKRMGKIKKSSMLTNEEI